MALTTDTTTQRPQRPTLNTLLGQHLNALQVRGYSGYTVRNRFVHIRFFLRWCEERGITLPAQITASILQQYAQYTFEYRKKNGGPLTVASRHARLVPLRVWFRWMLRQGLITASLADEIELPRLGRPLPRNILSAQEVERVMSQPDVRTPIGLRDRAILELLYSTGIRRLELVRLKLHDLQLDRQLIFVREGKGKRDRYVPIGARAATWVRRYVLQARPAIASALAADTVFLSRYGGPLSRDHLTWIARRYIASAKLGKSGACHLFRHTMATLMHENGADIRCIQQMLGHADIKTTQIYTQVAIRTLQRVHAETHPAERRS
jgi:integrase/recombinase XerD